jgi:putative DNA primase/helicase
VLTAAEIHERVDWPTVLADLGVADEFLGRRHGPCPACGGRDRYRFTNHERRGGFICNQCGAGDGFELLRRVFGWTFTEARRRVIEAAGLNGQAAPHREPQRAPVRAGAGNQADAARPTRRVQDLLRNACAVELCDDAVRYLGSRGLWPLPPGCGLRAHASAAYYERRGPVQTSAQPDGGPPACIGRFPALLAEVRDVAGELVTVHVTYLEHGAKLAPYEPRKILSPLMGRTGCAVRLIPFEGRELGIAEGIETALSAARIHGLPVWAALNTSLLRRFRPPSQVHRVVIFADRDVAGLEAAIELREHLEGRVTCETHTPPAPHKDWNDVLRDTRSGSGPRA